MFIVRFIKDFFQYYWPRFVHSVEGWSWDVKYGRHFNDVTYGELTDEDEIYLWCVTDQ